MRWVSRDEGMAGRCTFGRCTLPFPARSSVDLSQNLTMSVLHRRILRRSVEFGSPLSQFLKALRQLEVSESFSEISLQWVISDCAECFGETWLLIE